MHSKIRGRASLHTPLAGAITPLNSGMHSQAEYGNESISATYCTYSFVAAGASKALVDAAIGEVNVAGATEASSL